MKFLLILLAVVSAAENDEVTYCTGTDGYAKDDGTE